LGGAATGHAIKHLLNASFFVLLPEMKAGLGLTNTGVGALSTVRNVAGGAANLPAGFIADRYPSQWALILGLSLALVGFFHALTGVVQSLPLVVFAATMTSICITFWHPSAISTLSRRFAQRRGFAISVHGTGGSTGEALGPLIVSGLILLVGWRLVFRITGVPVIAAGLLIWLLLRRFSSEGGRAVPVTSYLDSLRVLLTHRQLLRIFAVVAGISAAQSVVLAFLAIYLQENVGYSSSSAKFYIFISQMVGVVSQPVMGLLSDRYGRRIVLLPAITVLALAVFAITLVPPGLPLLLTLAVMGAFQFPLTAILLASAADVTREDLQATVVSLVFAATITVSGVFPLLGGLVADSFGVPAAFRVASAIALATALFLAFQRWPQVAPAPSRPGDVETPRGS
jgi:MFS family permease